MRKFGSVSELVNTLKPEDPVYCIRPKSISISSNETNQSDIQVKGKITNTSFYGNLTYVYVEIEGIKKPLMLSTAETLQGLSVDSDCYLNIGLKDIRVIKKN